MKVNVVSAVVRILLSVILSFMMLTTAEAARQFTTTQTNPLPAAAQFSMGTSQPITFRITNTSDGANAGETISQVRFRVSGVSTTFSSATAAPVGWTRTAYSTTSVTFTANTAADRIPVAGLNYRDFTLMLVFGTAAADVNDLLRDVRVTLGKNVTNNNQGSWTLKALEITPFQAVSDSTGLPISSLVAGTPFRLVMTVTNNSSATQTSIISSPNPPTAVKTGVVTQGLTSTTYSPNPLTLAPGASGTITFRYTTNAADSGTIYFTAAARNSTNAATSVAAASNILAVGQFSASLRVTPACAYLGQTITVAMDLVNGYSFPITAVAPTLTPSVGAPVTLVTGPTPASLGSIGASSTVNNAFQWVYTLGGVVAGQSFTFSGSATGTGSGSPRTTPAATSGIATRGGFDPSVDPAVTNARSANLELTWTITNRGCDHVREVSITIPAGWTLSGSDIYSLVEQFNPPNPGVNPIAPVENVWTVSGANPVIFTATAGTVLPLVASPRQGNFGLVFSGTPVSAVASVFTIRITDSGGQFIDRPTTVTVGPYNSGAGGGNYTGTKTWREVY